MSKQQPPIYLDACATSPPSGAVLEAMAQAHALDWANPSSLHGFGFQAGDRLERSRQSIADALGAQSQELRFTSGATESLHLAILGAAEALVPGRILISAVEHPAVVAAAQRLQERGWNLVTIPVSRDGLINWQAFEDLLTPPTRLVSVVWGQSEVGAIQPLVRIGERCRQAGVIFHTDAVQVVGHQAIDFASLPVDLLSFTAHKIQGPRGIGGLLVRQGIRLQPMLGGGGQEFGLRSGTEAVPLVAGFAAAMAEARTKPDLTGLRNQLLQSLSELPGVWLTGPPPGEQRLPHHISLRVSALGPDGLRPLSGRSLVQALWQRGLAVSSGSACSGGSAQAAPSPILLAMGLSPEQASSGLRFSLGPWLASAELEAIPSLLAEAIEAVAMDLCR